MVEEDGKCSGFIARSEPSTGSHDDFLMQVAFNILGPALNQLANMGEANSGGGKKGGRR